MCMYTSNIKDRYRQRENRYYKDDNIEYCSQRNVK